nr:YafY family protein [uncultured Roseateles sp.]
MPADSQSKPTSRVLALLELLQAKQKVSGAELAQTLGVDARTVRRYIGHLQALGVPVQASRGCDGGYQLGPGHKLPPLMFTQDETLALAMGLRAARELGLHGILPAIASTQAKLERVSPKKLQKRLHDVSEVVAMEARDGRAAALPRSQELLALSAAARAQQRVQLRYRAPSGEASVRDVDVYGLAFRAGAWYAVGHCHLRRALRCFRLDRVEAVEARPASFLRPKDFDVLGHLAQAIAELPRTHSVQMRLHTELATARLHIAPELGRLEDSAGAVSLHAQIDDLAALAREISRWPFAWRVIKPAALRRELQELGERLQKLAAHP